MTKRAGILCPVFSTPGNQGIGDFGQKTIRFIDAIADAGYKIWQILPLQMTGFSHSPYQNLSFYAGDPIYINLDRLSEMGLLTQSSIVNCNKFKDFVDYDEVRRFKEPYLQKAFKAFKKNFHLYAKDFEAFKKEAFWLEEWTMYALFKRMYDQRPWTEWEEEYKNWQEFGSSQIDLKDYLDEMLYLQFLQFIFYKQFDEIRDYARSRGIAIMSNIPFYANLDSADVWAHKKEFLLDEQGSPLFVAGVPGTEKYPEGQKWDMPIYNFSRQQDSDFKLWKDRMRWAARNFDILRLDQFKNFDAYYQIPADKPATSGRWILGPRENLLSAIVREIPSVELIAEDMGIKRQDTLNFEEKYGISGMEVLGDKLDAKQLKKALREDAVVYTGTHDNATMEEEYANFDSNKRISLRRFFKKRDYAYRSFHDMIVNFAIDSDARTVILPIQDILGLKAKARLNVPGSDDVANWTWKLKDFKVFPNELLKTKPWLEKAGRL